MVVDLGFVPRKWQQEVFLMLARFSVLVLPRRSGKTVLAVLKLIDSALKCPRERGRYAYIAPLLKQAKDVAWSYLKGYAVKVPGTKVNESELWVEFSNGARIRIYGADNPDSMRGLYFDGVVLDEVAQMPRELWAEILLPTLADRMGWALFIGTPAGIDLFSEMYFGAVTGTKPGWCHVLKTVYEIGVFSDREIADIRAEMLASSGSDSKFQREFMCSFDASEDNKLIRIEDVNKAFERVLLPGSYEYAPKILGVDVAWGGGDRSVVTTRQGYMCFKPRVYQGLPEKNLALSIASIYESWKPDACFVDTTGGYGGEVLSRLQENGFPAQGVVFSWKASTRRFRNIRSEMWFKMAAWVKEGGALPNDPEIRKSLTQELCAPTYTNDNAANQFVLESKDDLRSRIGVSPDIADSLAVTFAFPVMARQEYTMAAAMRRGAGAADFDPREARAGDFDPLR